MNGSNQTAKNLVQRWLDDRSTGVVVRADTPVVKAVERLLLLKETAAKGVPLGESIEVELAKLPGLMNAVSLHLRLDEEDSMHFVRWMGGEIQNIIDGRVEAAQHWR